MRDVLAAYPSGATSATTFNARQCGGVLRMDAPDPANV
jgi:hypothetical protein